jgi:hypothetical protein
LKSVISRLAFSGKNWKIRMTLTVDVELVVGGFEEVVVGGGVEELVGVLEVCNLEISIFGKKFREKGDTH